MNLDGDCMEMEYSSTDNICKMSYFIIINVFIPPLSLSLPPPVCVCVSRGRNNAMMLMNFRLRLDKLFSMMAVMKLGGRIMIT